MNGLNYGLEFSEGTRISAAFEQSPTLAEVRQVVAQAGYADAQIQQTANIANSGQSGFQIQTSVLEHGGADGAQGGPERQVQGGDGRTARRSGASRP